VCPVHQIKENVGQCNCIKMSNPSGDGFHDLVKSHLWRSLPAGASSAVGAGAELCAPLAKLFEATGGATPLVYSNLVAVLALSLLLGNHDERRKDAIKAFTLNEGFEEVFPTMSCFRHICKNNADMQSGP
jgi:hypothetical protein